MPRGACDVARCLSALGSGSFDGGSYSWSDAPACCGFGHVGSDRTRELLRGRRLLFVGDSASRRLMWAVVDMLGGASAARYATLPAAHNASNALPRSNVVHDTRHAYHAAQTVLLNVDTARWEMFDPMALCGVTRSEWEPPQDVLLDAAKAGLPTPWHALRGARFRIRFELNRIRPDATSASVSAAHSPLLTAAAVRQSCRALVDALLAETFHARFCRGPKPSGSCRKLDAAERSSCSSAVVRLRQLQETSTESGATVRRPRRRPAPTSAPRDVRAPNGSAPFALGVSLGGGLIARGGYGGACAGHASHLQRALQRVFASGGALPAALSADERGRLQHLQLAAEVRLERTCESHCRSTRRLECATTRGLNGSSSPRDEGGGSATGFEASIRRALGRSSDRLQLGGRNASSLASLTFVYSEHLRREALDMFRHWGPSAYGYGSDLIVLGVTHHSVVRLGAAGGAEKAAAKATAEAGASASASSSAAVSAEAAAGPALARWTEAEAAEWRELLTSCRTAAASTRTESEDASTRPLGRCVLRSPTESLMQPRRRPYLDFIERVSPLAAAAGVALLDHFRGTWQGTAAGLFSHPDWTQIHFDDPGRVFLAQLTLNAFALLLPPREAPLPPLVHTNQLRLRELLPQARARAEGAVSCT